MDFTFSTSERVPSLASTNVEPYQVAKRLSFTAEGDIEDPSYFIWNYKNAPTGGVFAFKRVSEGFTYPFLLLFFFFFLALFAFFFTTNFSVCLNREWTKKISIQMIYNDKTCDLIALSCQYFCYYSNNNNNNGYLYKSSSLKFQIA